MFGPSYGSFPQKKGCITTPTSCCLFGHVTEVPRRGWTLSSQKSSRTAVRRLTKYADRRSSLRFGGCFRELERHRSSSCRRQLISLTSFIFLVYSLSFPRGDARRTMCTISSDETTFILSSIKVYSTSILDPFDPPPLLLSDVCFRTESNRGGVGV